MAFSRPLKGELRIGQFSSLRKLMRAARRGKIPDERQAIIDIAMRKAAERKDKYLSSHQRQMNTLVSALLMRRTV